MKSDSTKMAVAIGLTMMFAIAPYLLELYFYSAMGSVEAKNGTIDLTGRDFTRQGTVDLWGEWKVKWMEDNPDFIRPDFDDSGWDNYNLKKSWDEVRDTPYGYGWYRCKVKWTPQANTFLYLCAANSAYTLYINGREIMGNGIPGNSRESTEPQRVPLYKPLPLDETLVFAMKISNFHLPKGGLSYGLMMGTLEDVTRFVFGWHMEYAFEMGFMLMITVIFLILWLFKRDESANLHFALFNLFALVNFLCGSFFLESALPFFHFAVLSIKLETLSLNLACLTYVAFITALFREESPRRAFRYFAVCGLVLASVILFLPQEITAHLDLVNYLWQFAALAICGWTVIRALMNKREGAVLFLVVFASIVLTWINDMILASAIPDWPLYLSGPVMTFIYLVSIVFTAARHARISRRADYLAKNLQKEVERKTEELMGEQAERETELLVHTDKLTALGTLVSGVAHEIVNPAGIILLNAGVMRNSVQELSRFLDERMRSEGDFDVGGIPYSQFASALSAGIDSVLLSVEQINKIINELKSFVRKGQGTVIEDTDINDTVAETLKLMNHSIGRHTDKFSFQADKNLPVWKGNRQKLKQLVINLVQNAVEALPSPEKGVSVTTEYAPDKRAAILTVQDEGTGMDSDTLKKAFDPFFSTKFESGGTGLGLFVCRKITSELNGRIELESEQGRGTTARITFALN